MKIKFIQVSNILSFKHYDNVDDAPKIKFEDGVNIIIGENGSGKSTTLEILNFILRRIIYRQYFMNQDIYSRRETLNNDEVRRVIEIKQQNNYKGFRLEPNWDTQEKEQVIKIHFQLDEIDERNLEYIREIMPQLHTVMSLYSQPSNIEMREYRRDYLLEITLRPVQKDFNVKILDGNDDFGYNYLLNYNYYKELINIYNIENGDNPLGQLYESFTIISSFRNYNNFDRFISLQDQHPIQQVQNIKTQEFERSLNSVESAEPSIFRLVRLRVAEIHQKLLYGKLDNAGAEAEANTQEFLIKINSSLEKVGLYCRIKLMDLNKWQYSFEIYDRRREKIITDINSLSAGQKAILHLIFEAYGRGDLKGGVVIIDEPEIHLHHQFQHEYLEVIDQLNQDQNCQYILVTHSEALINSTTINQVKRFALSDDGSTEIFAPRLSIDQKTLIKILDNTRSIYAFFGRKVILVEGDSDRYFYKSILGLLYPRKIQEISILFIGGKGGFENWKELFESYGLKVYCIGDFDLIINRHYPSEKGSSLKTVEAVAEFKSRFEDWEGRIEADYAERYFIKKMGDLETYTGIQKSVANAIEFSNSSLEGYLSDTSNTFSQEIIGIINCIIQD